jgi:hypothetical protein
MLIFIIILAFLVIIYFNGIPLIKKGKLKEFILYMVIMIICFSFSILLSLGVKIPTQVFIINKLVNRIIK